MANVQKKARLQSEINFNSYLSQTPTNNIKPVQRFELWKLMRESNLTSGDISRALHLEPRRVRRECSLTASPDEIVRIHRFELEHLRINVTKIDKPFH
ncbi:MAG: hypothetical protein WC455_25950 [Dehalococcoidia bacterium]